jgi:hypothetical protein
MRIRLKKICISSAACLAFLVLFACRSAYVQTTIVNHTGGTVRLVEVDYPSASFGTQQIASNATYNYRFKVLGSGPVTITFTGEDNRIHTSTGPTLNQGQQGNLTITLDGEGKVNWTPELPPASK